MCTTTTPQPTATVDIVLPYGFLLYVIEKADCRGVRETFRELSLVKELSLQNLEDEFFEDK